jgi:hypothetical protein
MHVSASGIANCQAHGKVSWNVALGTTHPINKPNEVPGYRHSLINKQNLFITLSMDDKALSGQGPVLN